MLNALPLFFLLLGPARGQDATLPIISTASILPTYLSLGANINDFDRFADGGPDASWYIGYNNAWIARLPPAPVGDFTRAFIGAKIGRAKTQPNEKKPWLRERIDGKIYIGVSQSPSFTAEQSYFLTETADIPLEGDPHTHVAGVGSAEWFWTEIPLAMVSFTRPNYLIIWSPTKLFVDASSAPILGAASPDEAVPSEPNAWNNHSIWGVPPRNSAGSLQTPLNNLYPALAIKLVPPAEVEVSVSEFHLQRKGKKAVAQFSVSGENISEAWVETSRDQLDWERLSRIARRQPFIFTLPPDKLPGPGAFLRGVARDVGGTLGTGDPYLIPYEAH